MVAPLPVDEIRGRGCIARKPEMGFVFPYIHIRFLEIMAAAAPGLAGASDDTAVVAAGPRTGDDDLDGDADLELDEDFLRRIREV